MNADISNKEVRRHRRLPRLVATVIAIEIVLIGVLAWLRFSTPTPTISARTSIQPAHAGGVMSIAFAPDGRVLASGGLDERVRFWDVSTGEARPKLTEGARVFSIAFAPDGRTLACLLQKGTVSLWDVPAAKKRNSFEAYTAWRGLAFSPDSQTVASGGWDGTVGLWNATNGQERGFLAGHKSEVTALAFAPDGRILASPTPARPPPLSPAPTNHPRPAFTS